MHADNHSTNFITPDYWLAASLLAAGKKLLRLDWQGRRAFFVFADSANCEALSQAYWAGDLRVSAKLFADSLRTLKDRLHGNARWNSDPQPIQALD
jgi:hypothetical protein